MYILYHCNLLMGFCTNVFKPIHLHDHCYSMQDINVYTNMGSFGRPHRENCLTLCYAWQKVENPSCTLWKCLTITLLLPAV